MAKLSNVQRMERKYTELVAKKSVLRRKKDELDLKMRKITDDIVVLRSFLIKAGKI